MHQWYRTVLGFPDHLVARLLEALEVTQDHLVLDPFCGSGTTLIECKKRGINGVGIDASPSSVFAARVKTNWRIRSSHLFHLANQVESRYRGFLANKRNIEDDPTYRYLTASGMVTRGWISRLPLQKSVALKLTINSIETNGAYKQALMLALITEVVRNASNVRFGPELYCGPAKDDANVLASWKLRVTQMGNDLQLVRQPPCGKSEIVQGDSRDLVTVFSQRIRPMFARVICSPPYPAEHDYLRNARLELAFLEAVTSVDTLRAHQKNQVRSHTKGIYMDDTDVSHVSHHKRVINIADRIRKKTKDDTSGFARYYPRVVEEYFGGMKRHFSTLRGRLLPNARCAYVVGDQLGYAGVRIPTAAILTSLIEDCGYEVLDVRKWRTRRSSKTQKPLREDIILFRKPAKRITRRHAKD